MAASSSPLPRVPGEVLIPASLESYAGQFTVNTPGVVIQASVVDWFGFWLSPSIGNYTSIASYISRAGQPYAATSLQPTEVAGFAGEWQVSLTLAEVSLIGSIRVIFQGVDELGRDVPRSIVTASIVAAPQAQIPTTTTATGVANSLSPQLQQINDTVRAAIRDLLGNQMTNKPTWQRG